MNHRLSKFTFFFLVVAFFFISAILPACSQEAQIVEVVNTFYDSVEQGDRASLLSTLNPDIVEKIKKDPSSAGDLGKIYNFTEAVEKGKIRIKFKDRKPDVKIVSRSSASVKVNLTFVVEIIKQKKVRERLSEETFVLSQIRGKWLINEIVFRKN